METRIETETETETAPVSIPAPAGNANKSAKMMEELLAFFDKHPQLLEMSGEVGKKFLKETEDFEVTAQYINKAKKVKRA